jgi:hypothetical protein
MGRRCKLLLRQTDCKAERVLPVFCPNLPHVDGFLGPQDPFVRTFRDACSSADVLVSHFMLEENRTRRWRGGSNSLWPMLHSIAGSV